MAIREILAIPHPILRQRARKVRRVDRKLLQLAHDLVETMREAGGVGLAANQVGELRRLVVIQIPDEEEARIYINPEILKRSGTREIEEGCLSHAGYRAMVNRSEWIRFGAMDHAEKIVKIKTGGLLSQAMEHEVDHLNGILYLDHLAEHAVPYLVDEDGQPFDEEMESDEAESASRSSLQAPYDVPTSMKIK